MRLYGSFCGSVTHALAIKGEKIVEITEVRVRKIKKDDGRLKAVATITFDDCFVVHDIKIIAGEDGDFVAMPTRRTAEGEYKDICHPLNQTTRDKICAAIIGAYKDFLRNPT